MRLAAQEKMGFYPTPQSVTDIICTCLKIPEEDKDKTYRLLDPCCGKDETLVRIASHLSKTGAKTRSYGIELNIKRFQQAKENLTKAILGDALLEARVSNDNFSLLLLNPPYDWTSASDDSYNKRYEEVFLRKYLEKLQAHGVLVFIISYPYLSQCSYFLAEHFDNIRVFKFPEGEYERFRQIVIFGTRLEQPHFHCDPCLYYLRELKEDQIPELKPNCTSYTLPPVNTRRPPIFVSYRVRPEQLEAEIQKSGFNIMHLIRRKDNTETIRPLMPLRKGHLALLLASGFMDGLIQKHNQKLLIKGYTKRIQTEVVEKNAEETKTITTEKPVATISVLDFNKKQIFTVE